jgi:hypothetical protein
VSVSRYHDQSSQIVSNIRKKIYRYIE